MRILAVARKRKSWTCCGIQSDCHVGGRVDLSILRRCYGHTAAYHLKCGFAFVFSTASTDSGGGDGTTLAGAGRKKWEVARHCSSGRRCRVICRHPIPTEIVAMLAKGRGGFAVVYSRKLVAKSPYGDLKGPRKSHFRFCTVPAQIFGSECSVRRSFGIRISHHF